MKRIQKLALVLVVTIFFLALRTVDASSDSPFISPSEIHPGMVGYGKTVFEGTRIDTFKVVAIGILPKALSDTDLILVRIESPYLKGKKIGLVAGMSGSPVYFNGKLAGAVAYGWPFTQEPLAGITPIEPMLRTNKEGTGSKLAMGSPASIQIAFKEFSPNLRKSLSSSPSLSSLTLEPLGLPVSASGFSAEGVSRLQSEFPMFRVVTGGGTSTTTAAEAGPLEPGQSVSAALMEGDLSLQATGTLTYRDGEKVLAFGHPFLFLGDVDFPLFESYVHYVLPSLQLPFKFASPIREVGRVSQDRLYSIGGNLGQKAKMVPLDITVADPERHLLRSFHVRLFRHPDFTPRLTGAALEQAISSTSKMLGEATAHLDYELDFKDHPPLHLQNVVLAEQSISSVIEAELLKPMLRVLENDFEKVNLERIKVSVSLEPKLAAATLQRVMLSKHHLLPGEPLSIRVFLKPYNEKVVQKKFEIRFPSDIQGNVQVGVAGGTNADQLRKTMQQPNPEPLNVDQIIHQLQQSVSDNSLIIRLAFPRKGLHWAGEDFENMPQPYIDLLKAAGSDPLDSHADGEAIRHEMPWVVIGTDVEDITIGVSKEAPPSQSKPPRIPPHSPQLPSIPAIPEEPGSTKSLFKSPLTLLSDSSDSSSDLEESKTGSEENKTSFESISNLKDWQAGNLHHLAISPDGDLFLGPETEKLAKFEENVVFSEVRSGENLFAGTANPGKIYKILPSHEKSLFFDPRAVAVLSMASLQNGELLAGLNGGEIIWLDAGGRLKHKWKLEESYIWQILVKGPLAYIATGSPLGKIYTLNTSEENPTPKLYYTSSQSHILSLYGFADGRLFAGTSNDGLLLEIEPGGNARTVYDFNEPAILSLGETPDGKLIIGTSGKGKVFVLDSAGLMQKIADLPDENITWVGAQGEKILAGTGIPARLYALKIGRTPSLLWDGKENEQVAFRGVPGQINDYYVSGTHAALFNINPKSGQQGGFESKVLDTGGRAIWGNLSWHGRVPEGTEVIIQSRTGNSPVPDSTWSPWSPSYPESGQKISGSPSRYIQFRVELSSQKKETTPHLEAIHYFWRPENSPPSIEVSSPSPGDVIGPKTTLKGKIRAKDGGTVKVEMWLISDQTSQKAPEKLLTQLYAIPTSKGEDDLSMPLDMIHSEGHIQLKLTASDSPENTPETEMSSQTVMKDLIYDSSLPSLEVTKVRDENDVTYVQGVAKDTTSYIKSVTFRLDEGSWLDTLPDRGIYDSPEAKFTLELDHGLRASEIEIRALDGADNEKILKKKITDFTDKIKPKPKAKKSETSKSTNKEKDKSSKEKSDEKTEKSDDEKAEKSSDEKKVEPTKDKKTEKNNSDSQPKETKP